MITFLLLDYHKPTRPSLTFYRLPPPRALVNFHCLPCVASYAVLVPGPGEPASDVVSVLVLAIRESRAGAFKLSCGKGAGGPARTAVPPAAGELRSVRSSSRSAIRITARPPAPVTPAPAGASRGAPKTASGGSAGDAPGGARFRLARPF